VFLLKLLRRESTGCGKHSRSTGGSKAFNHGFTLIEVVLAIGVAAFAIVAMIGLMPAAFTSFRSALSGSQGYRIAQRVFHNVQMTDFSQLKPSFQAFDDQGRPISLATSPPSTCRYYARVSLSSTAAGSNSMTVLGNTSMNLMKVRVDVAENPNGRFPDDLFSTTATNYTTYTSLVGRKR
jgi:uncharacterized protein (TIGR02598 family)